MQKVINSVLLLILGSLVIVSCDKDDPIIPNEEELITTLTYTLTPADGGNPLIFSFRDLDGDGGDDPIISGGTLTAQTMYNGSVELLNESETPVENITLEIEEEKEEHQFFYEASIADLLIIYNDEDADGHPIGISTVVSTGNPGTGTLTITLRHEPDKSASGVTDGNIANAGGETDIQVSIPINVEA